MRILLLTCTFLLAAVFVCHAQEDDKTDPTPIYTVKMKDGKRYNGRILSSNQQTMKLVSTAGDTVELDKNYIKFLDLQSEGGEDQYNSSDLSRYFITSPAYTINEDELAFNTIWGIYTNFTYGITDFLSIEVGTSIPAILSGSNFAIFTPKVHLLQDGIFNLGISVSHFQVFPSVYSSDLESFTLMTANTTIGTPEKNLSLGVSYGRSAGESIGIPLFQFGGVFYLDDRNSFIIESQVLPFDELNFLDLSSVFTVIAGFRLRRKYHSFDLGLLFGGTTINDGPAVVSRIPFPYVAYNLDLTRHR